MTEPARTSQKAPSRGRRPTKRLGYGEGREALLKAAVRVVARRGLRHLTYRAVAEEAGVTHGLVVHHFGSRDTLIEESLAYAIRTSLSSSLLEPGTGRPEDFVAGLTDMVEGDPDGQAYQYELLLEARRRPELLPQVRELYDEYFGASQRELSRILPGDASPALNRLVFAALDGLVLHQVTGLGTREDTEAALTELRSLLHRLGAGRSADDD
ncbi:TetR family transcriptional regulator [Streptomyces sp. SID13726]|uniref:TetR/AcrR family transcriptional regulator n=1 Tax=Streptomyces sp. SID13726 TaxID=2706058 RepID=UPI0013BE0FEA|nr:TetR family transcriptional regulator [Streptomyces sp. SID13726]NEB03673.1 TetR family transcriptional regulator [Streptomyces sp. SID13726]